MNITIVWLELNDIHELFQFHDKFVILQMQIMDRCSAIVWVRWLLDTSQFKRMFSAYRPITWYGCLTGRKWRLMGHIGAGKR